MLRVGIISELGTGENLGYCRVSFDEVDMVSGWLPLPSFGTKTVKSWQPVEVNSQVACLLDDDCEQGCVTAVLWSNGDRPPGWANANTMGIQFADGAKVYYDAKVHRMTIDAPESEVVMTCKELNITGDVNVTGDITATKDVTAGPLGIKLTTHKHPTPAGVSGPPTP